MKHRKVHKARRPARRRSAAQRAATRKLVSLMKAKRAQKAPVKRAPVKRHRKAHRRASAKPTIARGFKDGVHRPVVRFKGGKMFRPRKRSRVRKHARFQNPFLGELAVLANPRRRKHHMKRRSIMLRNPIKGSIAAVTEGPKAMMKMEFIKDAVSVAAGFVLPNMVISKLPAWARDAHWKVYASKVVTVSVLAGVAGIVSKRVQKAVLLGGGISIILDLYADFVAPHLAPAPAAAPAPSVGTYFGADGLGTYFGGHEMGDVVDGVSNLADTY